MDKKTAEELVEKYVDGSLPADAMEEFERCMAEEPSIKESVDHAKLVWAGLSRLREKTPGEGYWRSYWASLSEKIFSQRTGASLRWRRVLVFGGAAACIVMLAAAALSYRAQLIRVRTSGVSASEELAGYFEPHEMSRNDQELFESLGSTYPGRMAWFARSEGEVFVGLAERGISVAGRTGRLLRIESVVVRTNATGDIEVLLRPRIAALDGASMTIELAVGTGDTSAVISASFSMEDGKVSGPVGFTWTTESSTASASSDDVSLALGEPSRVLSVTLDDAEYALLIRPSILREE